MSLPQASISGIMAFLPWFLKYLFPSRTALTAKLNVCTSLCDSSVDTEINLVVRFKNIFQTVNVYAKTEYRTITNILVHLPLARY